MHSTSKKPLNPFAPDYTPLPSRNDPPPSFPASAAFQPPFLPPPVYLLHFSLTHTPSHQQYSTYCVAQQTPVVPNPREKNGRRFDLFPEKKKKKKDEKITTPRFSKRNLKERNRHQVIPLKRDIDQQKTTIMIKNIPYDCTRKDLITVLDDFCSVENEKTKNEGTSSRQQAVSFAYDFIYLPIDFSSKRGRGFAFVNFTNAGAVWKFFDAFHQASWPFIQGQKWPKKIEIVCAKLQGKKGLVNHFRGSVFECESDEFLPAIFSPPRDGSGQPVELTVVGNRRSIQSCIGLKPDLS